MGGAFYMIITISLISLKLKIVLLVDAICKTTDEPMQLKSSLPVFYLHIALEFQQKYRYMAYGDITGKIETNFCKFKTN
jgi:hypothetical protein